MKIFASIFISVFILWCIACNNANNSKFNKENWCKTEDLQLHPNRVKMLDDLLKNNTLKGLTISQLIDKLGNPDFNTPPDSNKIYYNIITEYGLDIDPVYSKNLIFTFSHDSIINNFIIDEPLSN
ncbi:MAG: hypothetical protein ACEQSR_06745 [Candidatus Methylacidiphilales bacterium]